MESPDESAEGNRDEDLLLRGGRIDDAEDVGRIWQQGWRDAHEGHVPAELVAARSPESFGARASERISDTIVAVVDDEIAGFVMVVDDEVEQIYVAARHRGSGVAGNLLGEAERLVRAGGHNHAWLAVVAGNTRARRFYERNGWDDEGLFDYQASSVGGTITVPCHRYVRAF